MPDPKPTVGRIVHYYPSTADTTKKDGQPYPAVITHVFDDECVNLHVFSDGTFGTPDGNKTPTSVTKWNGEPDPASCWAWPPIHPKPGVSAQVGKITELDERVSKLEDIVVGTGEPGSAGEPDVVDPHEDMQHDDPDQP